MPKYLVRCYYATYVDVEVESENEKEAAEGAWDESAKPVYHSQLIGNLYHEFSPDVYPQQ